MPFGSRCAALRVSVACVQQWLALVLNRVLPRLPLPPNPHRLPVALYASQWSEIRELTHRARRSKMLEGKDVAHTEALKAVKSEDARMQSLTQI